jgi:vacuolar-type H+-ATPase subunit H
MTDKEFKRLSRSELIDIIYQLQLKQEELTADNRKLAKALADKRLRVSKAGNIAQASLEIHHVMQTAQDAAEHYLEEVKLRVDEEKKRILKNADARAAAITTMLRITLTAFFIIGTPIVRFVPLDENPKKKFPFR